MGKFGPMLKLVLEIEFLKNVCKVIYWGEEV